MTTGSGATLALLGGATPIQLCLMLSRVASRCSTCCRARATAGTSTSAIARPRTPRRVENLRIKIENVLYRRKRGEGKPRQRELRPSRRLVATRATSEHVSTIVTRTSAAAHAWRCQSWYGEL